MNINLSKHITVCTDKIKNIRLHSPSMMSFWFSCLCIIICGILILTIDRKNLIFLTVSIASTALVAMSLHLKLRNALKDPFHPDILLTIGHLMQYIIPILIIGTGYFNDMMSAHTRKVHTHFPDMIIGVLVAQTFFNLTFCLFPKKSYDIKMVEKKISLFIIALIIGIWSARSVLIATNSYFHVPSIFVLNSRFYSPLAVISTLGRIITPYMMIRFLKADIHRNKILPVAYIILELAWHLFSGKRMGLLIAFVCIILAYILVRKKIPVLISLVFIFILFFGSVFINHYRGVLRNQYGQNEKVSILEAGKKALTTQNKEGIRKSAYLVLDRLNDGQFAAGCFKAVPSTIDYFNGQTYKMILWIPVPRVLYKNRPAFKNEYNTMIARPQIKFTTCPVTTVGEAYINFGWKAIPIVFLILGIIYRCMEQIFRRQSTYSQMAIMIFFCVIVVSTHVYPVVSHLSWMLKIIVLIMISRFIESKIQRKKLSSNHNEQ